MVALNSIVLAVLFAAQAPAADPSMPHLRRQGTAVQLVVDGKPFLIRGGELGNSTAANPSYLRPFWPRFAELNMNTVLAARHLSASFGLLAQLEPLLLSLQGKGMTAGLLSEGPEQRQPQQVRLGDYVLLATFEKGAPPSLADGVIVPTGAPAGPPPPSGGLVLATAPDELIVAGSGVTITFTPKVPGQRAGILSAEEGRFVDGRWENVRWLGGDETHQGRHVRLEPGRFSLQRVRLYLY